MKIIKALLLVIPIVLSLASCRSVKYENYLNASRPVDHKLKGYNLSISQSSFIQAFNPVYNKEVVRVADDLTSDLTSVSSSTVSSNLANLCARYLQDDMEKNLVYGESGTENGKIIIQVVQSKQSITLEGIGFLNGLLLYTPMLVGVPVSKAKQELTLRMRIYDKDGKKVIDLKGSGSSVAFAACYYGYGLNSYKDKICLESLYEAMEDIKSQLKKSPTYESL